MLSMLSMTGCSSISNDNTANRQAPPPPPPPQPEPEPEPEIPNVGVGSLDYQPTCDSGFAEITYVYQTDSNIDPNSFIIVHSIDGERNDITTGSVYSNGSISKLEETIFIPENETEDQLAHEVQVTFISAGISQLQSFNFMQPACSPEPEEEETE